MNHSNKEGEIVETEKTAEEGPMVKKKVRGFSIGARRAS